MHCVILAGGLGTRLKPYTTIIPKPLMPVGEYSILEVILRQLKSYGVTKVTLSVGYLSEIIMAYCGDGKRFGLKINYILEDKPLGTGGVIGLMQEVEEPFLLMNGDLLTSIDYSALYRSHLTSNCPATLAVFQREIKTEFGVVSVDKNDQLVSYEEKPIIKQLVSTGIYVLSPEVKNHVQANQRMDMPELLNKLINGRMQVNTYTFEGYWLDIGRHDDYDVAVKEFSEKKKFFLKNCAN
jgi:NDP-sugar pyrophosphorylase family protein